MSEIDDGGLAFPISRAHFAQDGKMLSSDWDTGMSLRDWFAGQVMSAWYYHIPGTNTTPAFDKLANWCYLMADAMIKRREGGAA